MNLDPRVRVLGSLIQAEREFESFDRVPYLMAEVYYGGARWEMVGAFTYIEAGLVCEPRAQADWVSCN